MLTGQDIVCLSTQDWTDLWTRKQRFMKMFAENGNRVLYIETPVHLFGFDVLPHNPARFFRFIKGPRRVDDRLYVVTLPILLPMFQMFHTVNSMNQIAVAALLGSWIRQLGFRDPLLWIYTHFSVDVIGKIKNCGAVYECVDEFRATRGFVRADVVERMEDDLLRKVTVTIVTQENLLPRRRALCGNTFCVPNGADVHHFAKAGLGLFEIPPDIEKIPRPRFGFVGHIHYWIDLSLIRFLAERSPEWSFVLIGPIHSLARTRQVKHLRNVRFLGRKPQSEVPAYIQAMDCCLNPYIEGILADHCSPLKLYEYLAAGKPIVSTEMPEARKFGEFVCIASSYSGFWVACESVLQSLPEPITTIQHRLKVAAEHSWENRFRMLNHIVSNVLAGNTSGKLELG